MPSITEHPHFPYLPSFTLLLTSPRVVVPGPPIVLKMPPISHYSPNNSLTANTSDEPHSGEHSATSNLQNNTLSFVENGFSAGTGADELPELGIGSGDIQVDAEANTEGMFCTPFLKNPPTIFTTIAAFLKSLVICSAN